MAHDNIGNTTQGKVVGTVRLEIPAGTQIVIGGHPCRVRYDAIADADPIYATFIKASIERQHEPIGSQR